MESDEAENKSAGGLAGESLLICLIFKCGR